MSVFQKVLQLPMSYDCLTHMLTHPLRDYMFGLRGGLFRLGLTRSLRGSIRYCPHRNCLREPFVASFSFILAFCGFISFHFDLLCLPQQCGCLVCVAKGPMAASSIPPKTWGTYAGPTRRLRGAYADFTSTMLLETSQFIILWMVHSWSCHSCLHPLSSNLVASYPTYLTLREKPYATC